MRDARLTAEIRDFLEKFRVHSARMVFQSVELIQVKSFPFDTNLSFTYIISGDKPKRDEAGRLAMGYLVVAVLGGLIGYAAGYSERRHRARIERVMQRREDATSRR